jgi:tetratricopeptide (TPR) repeat protein
MSPLLPLNSVRFGLVCLALTVAAPAAAQVSTSLPPQTVGDFAIDREPPTELQQVQRLIAAGKSQQALERADAALAKNPRDAQMRFVRGVILADLKQTEQAKVVFQQLTEDFPELPEPYNNLAVLYASEGKLTNARAALEAALVAAPNYGTAYENLGDLYLQLAADAYQRAMSLEPANRQAAAKLTLSRELIAKARAVR